jgi:hypothetical protein
MSQARSLDAERISEPLLAHCRYLQPLAFSGRKQTMPFQVLGEDHPEFAGQVVVTGTAPPQCFRCGRPRSGAAGSDGEWRQAFQRGRDLRPGQSVIAVSSLAFHYKQAAFQ